MSLLVCWQFYSESFHATSKFGPLILEQFNHGAVKWLGARIGVGQSRSDGAPKSAVPCSILAKTSILGVKVLKVLWLREFEWMSQAAYYCKFWSTLSTFVNIVSSMSMSYSGSWHPATTAAQGRFVLTALHLAVTASATWQRLHLEYPFGTAQLICFSVSVWACRPRLIPCAEMMWISSSVELSVELCDFPMLSYGPTVVTVDTLVRSFTAAATTCCLHCRPCACDKLCRCPRLADRRSWAWWHWWCDPGWIKPGLVIKK